MQNNLKETESDHEKLFTITKPLQIDMNDYKATEKRDKNNHKVTTRIWEDLIVAQKNHKEMQSTEWP